ncbi:MAG: alpha-ketoglutarate decarboxylase [Actinobacteria bacterium 69-20]|nr:multifunctional oxoglutarate decarboxylase/oxoglutarate dehydrogenase thiamine pyrophosphate-binding subunit/dihydrolipoyllysine-residue succinyltransferase subunit [Actinomycetota bacterium]OJV24593.1 MAG: alpha-ketoglutarate decarboxylase [Actinobacteria bacterium 69-20]
MSSATGPEFGPNDWFVEEKYQQFLADPASVGATWRSYFAELANGSAPNDTVAGRSGGTATAVRTAPRVAAPAMSAPTAPPASAPPTAPPAPTAPSAPPAATPAAPPTDTPARPTATVTPADVAAQAKPAAAALAEPTDTASPLRGPAAAVVRNMIASLEIPTATSVRAVPAKLIADNRIVINNFLRRHRRGKISFTHLIGYAMVRALADFPGMNRHFAEIDGKPQVVSPAHINLGLAIDLPGKGGNRSLVVVPIKATEHMTFTEFWTAYEDVVHKTRDGNLTMEDFAGTTISLTNPGGIGTVHSVPRLMSGQGAIIGVGAMEYPAEFQGASEETIAELGVSKIMTLTSTYDHRIIQGAESGEFLKRIHALLLGESGFYDDVFADLRVPYEPVRWVVDRSLGRHGKLGKTARVLELIDAYRTRGHLMADIDPLNYRQRKHPDLDVLEHDLTLWDLEREFPVGGFNGEEFMKLRDVLGVLRDAYCRTVGVEYMHIMDPVQRRWIQERVERHRGNPDVREQKYILSRLNAAEAFETFLQTKYIGQKRFSLEGGETLIPLLDVVLATAVDNGLDEVVIGMAHRGRLNVLANIIGKPYSQIFREFEDNRDPSQAHGSGDVKYHLGAEGKYIPPSGEGQLDVSMVANPSHLEVVDPVLEGVVRAKQDVLNKGSEKGDGGYSVMAVMLHGDAAFAGQGVVAETLNLSQLRGYRTGGTVHVVINNQVGFTTAPEHSRSGEYSTDVAKMIQAPIFHVNGDDPEAAAWVARLAVEYRQRFSKDVVIDMVCYRRRGHNEGDDPSMTNPQMYEIIDGKRSVRTIYTEALVDRGDLSPEDADELVRDYHTKLERVFNEVRELEKAVPEPSPSVEAQQQIPTKVITNIPVELVHRIGDAHVEIPETFTVHPRVKTVLDRRQEMSRHGGIDWAFAELLALGSIAAEGRMVRVAGQDTRRGTFSQRHAALIDRKNGAEYLPLQHLTEGQERFLIYDSALTEYAALGFEYGYSVANRDALVIWEAQFGDFVNGAQSVIDEYLSSGEAKWGEESGVVLLLPHGQEGQGPDHTSGRIERFLQLCAEGSMTVAEPSTPANYFHLLRRHVLDGVHRPMIVYTPKSMLRLKDAVSAVEDFTTGKFESVLPDTSVDPSAARTVLLVSGKLYYELDHYRTQHGITDTAIVRLEQLYPIPRRKLESVLAPYGEGVEFRWVQEEPRNQGAWSFMAQNLPELLPRLAGIRRVSRRAMAAPSAGSAKVHAVEQQAVISEAFA